MERYQGLIFFYQSEIAFHLVQKSPDHLSKALSQLPGKLTVQNQEKVYRVSYEWHSYRKSKEVLVKEDSPKNLPLKNKEDSNSSQ
ncbi:hypothetical protein [Atopobacter sp. AH10]|uniref:hypothetical protein n=1 Tax=Atopobacter sp. AH10 TaxID=2315861 RepID=UPI0011C48956|nr:hypothetical protein [Atopobacter sp. AH10]